MDTQQNITIYLPRKALAAMLSLVPKFDVRYYLLGVNVEASRDTVRLTATDGHVLGTYSDKFAKDAPAYNRIGCAAWSGIVPTDAIKAMRKPGKYTPELVTLAGGVGGWRLDDGAAFKMIGGRFPAYRELFAAILARDPKKREPGQFNPDLLARFSKFLKLLDGRKVPPALLHDGTAAALVQWDSLPEFAGIIMPFRADPHAIAPERSRWVLDEVADPAPKVKPAVVAKVAPEIAAAFDPSGALQNAGLMTAAA